MNKNKVNSDFSVGSVAGNIIRLAIPLSLALVVNALYNVVDRIYLGHIGEGSSLALTGVGLVFPITTIVHAFSGLFGAGGTPLFSIARGKGDTEEAKRVLGSSFTLLCGAGVVVAALCLIIKAPILYAFGASEDTFPFANDYITIFLFGTVFVMLSTGINGYINAQGFGRTGMMTVMLGAAVNIALDPIFIFVFDMGVKGAALATVIAQFCSALWAVSFLRGKRAVVRLEFKYMKLELKRVLSIMSLGLSNFIMSFTTCAVLVVGNKVLSVYGGDLYIGCMTVINSVREVMLMLANGISQAAQPVIAYNYGAKKYSRVKRGIVFISIAMFIYGIFVCLIAESIPGLIARVFTDDAALYELVVPAMRLYFFGFAFISLQFAGQTTFLALKKSKHAIFFSLLRKAIIVIPLMLLLPPWLGVNGVYLSEPVSDIVGGLACYTAMLITVSRELKKDEKLQMAEE